MPTNTADSSKEARLAELQKQIDALTAEREKLKGEAAPEKGSDAAPVHSPRPAPDSGGRR